MRRDGRRVHVPRPAPPAATAAGAYSDTHHRHAYSVTREEHAVYCTDHGDTDLYSDLVAHGYYASWSSTPGSAVRVQPDEDVRSVGPGDSSVGEPAGPPR